MNSNTDGGTAQRRVSVLLVLGIIIFPIGFAWELLRDGHNKTARNFALGWCAIWMILYFIYLFPLIERPVDKPAAQYVSRSRPAAIEQKSMREPVKIAVKPVDPEKIKYLEAIEREIKERERTPSMTLIETDDKAGVTAAMLTLGLWGKLYMDGNYLELNPAEEARRQLFRKLAERAQAEAFPKVRAMQARAWRNGMWEHDVDVEGSGPRNTHLRLRGGVFFAHRAMKEVMESMQETVNMLHFTRVTFEPYRGAEYSYFSFTPPPDDQLATVGDHEWFPIAR